VKRHPKLVVDRGDHFQILRTGDRCAALVDSNLGGTASYSCVVYDDRPKTCRDFAPGGEHCLTARARVGLSL